MTYQVLVNVGELEDLLHELNDGGREPTVVGRDKNDVPFLAYGWDQGDTMGLGISLGDHFDEYQGVARCEECTASERLTLQHVSYPVRVFL